MVRCATPETRRTRRGAGLRSADHGKFEMQRFNEGETQGKNSVYTEQLTLPYRKLLGFLTYDHVISAFSVSVNQTEYREVMGIKIHGHPAKYWFCGAYSFCVTGIADIA